MNRWISVMVLLTAACGLTDPRESNLDANRRLWNATGPDAYSLVLTRSCFCGGPSAVRIVVVNGVVASRTVVGSETPLDPAFDEAFPDIPGLFTLIRDAFQRKASTVSVNYAAGLGYPTSLSIDYQAAVTDDELVLVVSEFQSNK